MIADISFFELDVFVTVCQLHSIASACRDLQLNPSNVSKVITRIEQRAGARLMSRSRTGISLTPEGVLFREAAERILELAPELNIQERARTAYQEANEIIGLASLSFVCTRLVSPCLGEWQKTRPKTRFRICEFSNNKLTQWASKEAFDVAIHIEKLNWPKKWLSEKLGDCEWGLYSRVGHPLSTTSTADQVLGYPFVIPTGWSEKDGEFLVGQDQCPIPVNKRIHGSEATTAENALEIIQSTHHLCFVPEIATAHLLNAGKIKHISVQGWPEVRKAIYLTVNSERVKKSTYVMIKNQLRLQLAELSEN